MATLKHHDFRQLYLETCWFILQEGRRVAPRGQPTREVPAVTLELTPHDRTAALPMHMGRGVNPAIGAAEAAQLIGEVQAPELMTRISSNFKRFIDGGSFHGGYGQRVRGQTQAVLHRLRADRDSRQAIMSMWDPQQDLHVEGMHDYPCTVFLQFLIRDDKLEMHTHMRSNDVWWGLGYDVFVFTQLQWTLARLLWVDPGSYFHHAASLHLYERDAEKVRDLVIVNESTKHPPEVTGFGMHGMSIQEVQAQARRVLRGEWLSDPLPATDSEVWYREVLEPYVG